MRTAGGSEVDLIADTYSLGDGVSTIPNANLLGKEVL